MFFLYLTFVRVINAYSLAKFILAQPYGELFGVNSMGWIWFYRGRVSYRASIILLSDLASIKTQHSGFWIKYSNLRRLNLF